MVLDGRNSLGSEDIDCSERCLNDSHAEGIPPAFSQGCNVGSAVADAPYHSLGQHPGLPLVNGTEGLPQVHPQFRRVHAGHLAQVVQQFLV